MEFQDFLRGALTPSATERRGQALMNALAAIRPGLASQLIHKDLDPFYNDAKLWAAVEFIQENWNIDVGANYTTGGVR